MFLCLSICVWFLGDSRSRYWVFGMSMMDGVFLLSISSHIFLPMCLVVGECILTLLGAEFLAAFKVQNQVGVFTQIGAVSLRQFLCLGKRSLRIIF